MYLKMSKSSRRLRTPIAAKGMVKRAIQEEWRIKYIDTLISNKCALFSGFVRTSSMKQRSLIKSQIIQAWNRCISEDYCAQRINSERSLQASFWSHLSQLLSKNRRLFIEPGISIRTKNGPKTFVPDIVVCNTREVISIIELKYLPRTQPRYKKDIESLSLIAENRHQIIVANDRFRGAEKDSNKYSLSKDILFVWAGVHAKEKTETSALYSAGHKSLDDCYLQLHAVTVNNSKPNVLQRK